MTLFGLPASSSASKTITLSFIFAFSPSMSNVGSVAFKSHAPAISDVMSVNDLPRA